MLTRGSRAVRALADAGEDVSSRQGGWSTACASEEDSSESRSRSASTRLNTITSPSAASSAASVVRCDSRLARLGTPRVSSASSFIPGGRLGYPEECCTTSTATLDESPEGLEGETRIRYWRCSRSSNAKSSS